MTKSIGDTRGRTADRGPSQRQLRVGELVRQALSEALTRGEPGDPELMRISITVSEVKMSPDLRRATCYVMPLGGGNEEQAVKALASNAGPLSHEVARRVSLKFAPRLLFQVDRSFDAAARIDALLAEKKVRADLDAGDDENGPSA